MHDDYGNIWTYRGKWAYLLMVVGMLLLPSFYVIYISFNEYGFGARIYEFTFDWYRVVLGDTMLVAQPLDTWQAAQRALAEHTGGMPATMERAILNGWVACRV